MNRKIKVIGVSFMIMSLVFAALGCNKGQTLSQGQKTEKNTTVIVDVETNEEIVDVINNWAEYINNQDYEKAFSLFAKMPPPDELKTIEDMYSKSLKSFKFKDAKLNEEYHKRYGDSNSELVYVAYFETEFTATNLTAFEDDPMRFVVMRKVGGSWKIDRMVTGL